MVSDVPVERAARLGLLAAGLALGAVSLAVARGEPAYALGGGSLTAGVAGLLAGWSLLAAGLGAWVRRPTSRLGPLVAAAGVAWFLAEWNNPGAGVAVAFTAGLVLQAACPPLVGHAALAYPSGRLRSRLERVAVTVAYGRGRAGAGDPARAVLRPHRSGLRPMPRQPAEHR